MKKLVRMKKNGILGGVLAGLGEYLSIDPVILRIVFVILFLLDWFRWVLIIGYIVCWIILPVGETERKVGSAKEIKDDVPLGFDQTTSKSKTNPVMQENAQVTGTNSMTQNPLLFLIAVLLIGGGIFLVFQNVLPNYFFSMIRKFSLAFVLIAVGILLLSQNLFKKKGE